MVGIAECRQCGLYIRFRGWCEHARLTYLGHVGGHKAWLYTLYNNALLAVLCLQIIAELVHKCLNDRERERKGNIIA